MYIKIANLSDGDHFFDFDEDVKVIGLAAPFNGRFKANIKLSKQHSQIVLKSDLEVEAVYECDRCTADYKTSLSTKYQVVYFFSREKIDDDSGDIIYLSPDADVIDISKELKDYALLAVPMKKLCSENCKGLCPTCGKDLNAGDCQCSGKEVDPRWEPLLKLKNILNNN